MVSGPQRDAFQVQHPADLLGVAVPQNERQHADFFAGRADQPQAVDPSELLGGVLQQFLFVLGDAGQSQPVDVVQRRAQAHGVGNARGAGLEPRRAPGDRLTRSQRRGNRHSAIAALAAGEPTLFEAFFPAVVRRPQPAKVGNVFGTSDELIVQIGLALLGESHNPHPLLSPRPQFWCVEIKLSYQALRLAVFRLKRQVGFHRNVFRTQQAERIADRLVALDRVAAVAGIDQIEIVESPLRIQRLRPYMIQIEVGRDLPPRLAFQAIDATKTKFVAEPRAVGVVTCIPRWPVAASRRCLG